jgi:hypothetical protein
MLAKYDLRYAVLSSGSTAKGGGERHQGAPTLPKENYCHKIRGLQYGNVIL